MDQRSVERCNFCAHLGRIARWDFCGDGVVTACQRLQKSIADSDVFCRGVFDTCAGTDDWSSHPADNSSFVSRDSKCTMNGRILLSERGLSNFGTASLYAWTSDVRQPDNARGIAANRERCQLLVGFFLWLSGESRPGTRPLNMTTARLNSLFAYELET